jgi:phenylalanyl-tRNA synthetase beta chain
MQLPYSWLKELSGATVDATEAARLLTRNGIAVEKIERVDQHMTGVIIARVEEVHAIEGAKIRRTAINTGKEILQVVCGAPNVAAGQLVAFAPIGATVAGPLTIGQAKIRGVDSFGMICSERELGLSDAHAGIIALEGEYPLGASFAEALGYNDTILHFEITPNRGDCLSAFGIARELAAALGTQTVKLSEIVVASNQTFVRGTVSAVPSISIESSDDTPRFTVRLIEGITNGQSPAWMQQRLKRLGLRPISLAVDITNYVMHEMGNPMHAFDADRFGPPSYIIRRATSGEKVKTLDDKERSLTSDVLVVADPQQSRALAGVMGGGTSEVHEGQLAYCSKSPHSIPRWCERGGKSSIFRQMHPIVSSERSMLKI